MAERQINLTSMGSLNPLKLRKDDYVLRIEKAIERTSAGVGQTLEPVQRTMIATVIARDILRSTMEHTERNAKDAEKDVPRRFKNAVKILTASGGLCLLSLGVGYYANGTDLERYVEISKVGFVGAWLVSIFGIKDTLEGTFSFVTAKVLRKRLPRFISIIDQLENDLMDMRLNQSNGPDWKN